MSVAGPVEKRRRRYWALTVGLLSGVFFLAAITWRTAPRGARLDVVLITLDTVRADHFPGLGGDPDQTPALAALVEQSTLYDAAHCTTPVTAVSHVSMLASLRPKTAGFNDHFHRLDARAVLLPEVLREAGYRTGAVVSSPVLNSDRVGLHRGFAVFHDTPAGSVRAGREAARLAIEFLRRDAGRPAFLWLHLFDAHGPYPADAASDPVPDGADDAVPRALIPPYQRDGTLTSAAAYRARYRRGVRRCDDAVGAVLAHLRATGKMTRTLIIVAGDHGESLGEHGIWFDHFGCYEQVAQVALSVYDPRVRKRRRVTRGVSTLDIMPTVLDRLGLAAPEGMEGEPLPVAEEAAPRGERLLAFEHPFDVALAGYRGSRKLIMYGSEDRFRRTFELLTADDQARVTAAEWGFRVHGAPQHEAYELADDPGERHNQLRLRAAEGWSPFVQELALLRDRPSRFRAQPLSLSEQERRLLQALGYAAGP